MTVGPFCARTEVCVVWRSLGCSGEDKSLGPVLQQSLDSAADLLWALLLSSLLKFEEQFEDGRIVHRLEATDEEVGGILCETTLSESERLIQTEAPDSS